MILAIDALQKWWETVQIISVVDAILSKRLTVNRSNPSTTRITSFQRVVDRAKVHLRIIILLVILVVTYWVRTARSISTWSNYRRERKNPLIILKKLLYNIMDERLLASNDLRLLILCDPYGELFELLDYDIPILSLAHCIRNVFKCVESRIKRKRFFRFLDYGLSYLVHQLADIESVFKPLSMFSVKLHPLLLYLNFVSLIILNFSSVNEPEVKIYVDVKRSHLVFFSL